MSTGTHDISTLLAVNNTSIATYGIDRIQPILEQELQAHNAIVSDYIGSLAETSTDRQRKYGTSTVNEMIKADEYSRAPTQKSKPGATVGFPLERHQFAIGWTQDWFNRKTPADMAVALQNAQRAHLRALMREAKRALLLSGNFTFSDFLVDDVDLNVKRLVNGDSASIPEGPNSEVFDGATHTHYLARAGGALAVSDLLGGINHVVEHGHGNMVKLAINKGDELAVRALTGFIGYPDPRVIYRNTDTPGRTLDITKIDNRAIGILGGAEVWVKPWMNQNYGLIWDEGSPRPLVMRQPESGPTGLYVAGENSAFPLYARYMQAEFGFGAWNRTNGAVVYWGGTTYADPVIN